MRLFDAIGTIGFPVPLLQGPLLTAASRARRRRRYLVPEVIQSSAMDCGPAALVALLGGFGIEVSYGRLREAGQTDVDGTSLDTLEELANLLGLEAEQVMVPPEHLFSGTADLLPAIVAVRCPDGAPHFVVAWRRVGRYLQLMDPAAGRRFTTCERFRQELFIHAHRVSPSAWREWASSDAFTEVLDERMSMSGSGGAGRRALIRGALQDRDWSGLATLDAKVRMIADLVEAGAVRRGVEAQRLLEALDGGDVPDEYWSVRSPVEWEGAGAMGDGESSARVPAAGDVAATPSSRLAGPDRLVLRGAVLVTVRGVRPAAPLAQGAAPRPARGSEAAGSLRLDDETRADLGRRDPRPERKLFDLLREDGLGSPALVGGALLVSAAAVLFEALLLRGLLDVGARLGTPSQRLAAAVAVLLFVGALLLTEVSIAHGLARLGRRLEIRLRMALLRKLPRLEDRYLRSRLFSDMAQRAHLLHRVRTVSGLGGRLLRSLFELTLVAAAIAWLDPRCGLLAVAAAVLVVAVPLAAQRRLGERDLRAKSQSAALARFYLDGLLGLASIRACDGERNFVRQHEIQTSAWVRAALDLHRGVVGVQAVQLVIGFGFAGWILTSHLSRHGVTGTSLLLVYWALRLPALGEDIVRVGALYPGVRNVVLRLLEPLGAPEESGAGDDETQSVAGCGTGDHGRASSRANGVHLRLENLAVAAGGSSILEGVDLELLPGTHVAVVGPSGAGKSTLVATLLGFHRAAKGRVLVDGRPLRGAALVRLRRQTAWVDPDVQLWNRSFLDNLTYGLVEEPGDLSAVLRKAETDSIVERLPEGMSTPLGEGGGLLSGGEGQRVRLARALLRSGVRLVLLDEALRGLDRDMRGTLLARCRAHWAEATMLFVTHDLWLTTTFDRIVVVERGRIVETGEPAELLGVESRYRELVEAEAELRRNVWGGAPWRRLHLENGRLQEIA